MDTPLIVGVSKPWYMENERAQIVVNPQSIPPHSCLYFDSGISLLRFSHAVHSIRIHSSLRWFHLTKAGLNLLEGFSRCWAEGRKVDSVTKTN